MLPSGLLEDSIINRKVQVIRTRDVVVDMMVKLEAEPSESALKMILANAAPDNRPLELQPIWER